ncbi:c-di-AMP phosphodiesterase-like protein [Psychrobacillus insolitus]|uniref:Cyclic-di-AMP phosphodiesterase n=1 Tax=Psychrobacillus insolitus TaxID=1461 RepID=A0A2W7N072_9BACI|nr:DHH family phosphoesterase [Psychrobacillus insolitus]PZX03725.1 c-di-AMP phosphodiesterase-like protein [Psychrobacillus insolitus]
MASFFRKRPIRYPLFLFMLLGGVASYLLLSDNTLVGLLFALLVAGVSVYSWTIEQRVYEETEKHIETLSYRMKKVGEEALLEMPIGILLINDHYIIEWANPYMMKKLPFDTIIGEELISISKDFQQLIKNEDSKELTITFGDNNYKVLYKAEERLLYFFDITEQLEIESLYYGDRTVIGVLFIDNYDEIAQGMDDQTRGQLNSLVTSSVNNWGAKYGIFVKRISSDRFLAVFNESILVELEKNKFAILDDIRDTTTKFGFGLTLSVGVGAGSTSLVELGELSQSSLDLVLGRGGDQVAIKHPSGKVKFYGGKTNPVEKRTRVRARVISHALRDLIQESDQVFVMGHRMPDMDAIGAAVGVRKMAQMNKVEGYVIIDFNELDNSVLRLIDEIKKKPELFLSFITPEEAMNKLTDKTLLVVVDTHKPSLVIDEKLLQRSEKIVVIDHHRRGEEFITPTLLVYMEPYASSTSELVTELLEYQPKNEKITMLEATSMLAGIIVDTKSFTLRTGARTFEAASYLRTHGADTVLVQKMLKEDLSTYIERSKIVQTVEFIKEGIAIAHGPDNISYSQVLLAQTADILLTMDNVSASFVIGRKSESSIGISARSLGEINVQLVMEQLNGGGHLTNAACQLENKTIEEATTMLKQAIEETFEGGRSE